MTATSSLNMEVTAEIHMAELPFMENSSIQGGKRPVLLVSNKMNNTYSRIVNVYPFTSKKKKEIPTHINFNADEYGLKMESILLMEQPLTIDKSNLLFKIGEIKDMETLKHIANVAMIQIPIFGLLTRV